MSVDAATRLKEESVTMAMIATRRPHTRVVIGVAAALVYFAILAFAGIFISGAVNSMNDHGAAARAVVRQIAGDPVDATSDPQSPPLAAAPTDAPRAAAMPPKATAAKPNPVKQEPPRAIAAAPPLPQATVATPAPSVSAAADVAKKPSRTAVAALTPATVPTPVAITPPSAPTPQPKTAPTQAAPTQAPAKLAPQQADTAETRALVTSGDARRASGDIASARLYYERAAEAGDARAARLLANSYDPAFLERWGVLGMTGNAQEAARWYRLASGLGDPEAARDLASLQKQ